MVQKMTRLSDVWSLLAVRATFALLFGFAAILWPGPTIAVLVAIFGAFVLLDGVLLSVVGVRSRGVDPRWWSLLLLKAN